MSATDTAGNLLIGYSVGLSISGVDDDGLDSSREWEVNRFALRFAQALVRQGASLTFGHDWRQTGLMQSICSIAARLDPHVGRQKGRARITNVVPWPDECSLSEMRERHLPVAFSVQSIGLPFDLTDFVRHTETHEAFPIYRYLRARALTHLRHSLTRESDGRFCAGGMLRQYAGRYPGVLEEALITMRAAKPLYLAGILGGATCEIIRAVRGENHPTDLCPNEADSHYHNPIRSAPPELIRAMEKWKDARSRPEDLESSADFAWQQLKELGVDGLAERNGLSARENELLFSTESFDEVVALVLTGLGRCRGR